MKRPWFKRVGWFHVPVSVPGALVSFAAATFSIYVFLAIDQ
jgi:hypothetical protein